MMTLSRGIKIVGEHRKIEKRDIEIVFEHTVSCHM